jgi:Zn-dependent M28 family amino/carboxypeptidase
VTLMKRLGLRPRRTVRVVLWTNEENGLAGGRAYREWIGEGIKNHVAAIEMDGGSEAPAGFGLGMAKGTAEQKAAALGKAREIAALLAGLNAGEMREGGGGADIGPLTREGVPGFGHLTRGGRYFEWHHTEADTLDKIDARDFRMNTAALAVLAYVLADMREPLVK